MLLLQHTHTHSFSSCWLSSPRRLVIILFRSHFFFVFGSFRFDFILCSFITKNAAAIACVGPYTHTHALSDLIWIWYIYIYRGYIYVGICLSVGSSFFRAPNILSSDYLHQLLIAIWRVISATDVCTPKGSLCFSVSRAGPPWRMRNKVSFPWNVNRNQQKTKECVICIDWVSLVSGGSGNSSKSDSFLFVFFWLRVLYNPRKGWEYI